jgi:hypothetical protein
MGYNEDASLDIANGLPALLPFDAALLSVKGKGIEEYLFGGFESNLVFALIGAVFGFVPFDPHPTYAL